MLDIRDVSEKDKVFWFVEGLKPWARAKLYKQRVQDLTLAYVVAEWLFDLTSDSQDVRRHQSFSPARNRNSCPSSPKAVGGDECPGFRKDEGREFRCPTYRRTSEANDDKAGRWKGPVDFVVVKMDFDVVLGMKFLLEHQVIPMPSTKSLAITGSFPTVVQADIRQPNGFKMISTMQLDESPAQEEPPSVEIFFLFLLYCPQ
ncbi:reverse transcriptase [Cucumis melo var. makuwa]|uniref:Reverse transcriptase n=1 Tax=Cucumis melo var. makuwa TaxID=1194695 RepID=A0A5D3DG42_CUCMM|nr:reverse transcriptase [Cucumis melo var. makuwa]